MCAITRYEVQFPPMYSVTDPVKVSSSCWAAAVAVETPSKTMASSNLMDRLSPDPRTGPRQDHEFPHKPMSSAHSSGFWAFRRSMSVTHRSSWSTSTAIPCSAIHGSAP